MRRTSGSKSFPYQGLTINVDPDVYEPAEDTYLLLDQLHSHPGETILEIGTGSGLIALVCARAGSCVVASDISRQATRNCQQNVTRNRSLLSGSVETRQGDLFTVVKPGEMFDMIVFNPPYVPTSPGERFGRWLDLATSGGRDGLEVTARFIREVRQYLTPDGCAYTIISSRSPVEKLSALFQQGHVVGDVVGRLCFTDEEILCYRLTSAD